MEADWAAEIGSGFPVIEASWRGFVDLMSDSSAIGTLPEAASYPPLRESLLLLNGPESPLLTSKCDFWTLEPDELDSYEYDSTPADCVAGAAVYIDLTGRDPAGFASFVWHESWARQAVARLRALPVPHGRVDLVVRAAERAGEAGFGVTLYAAGCGSNPVAAQAALAAILDAATAVTMEAAQNTGE